MIHASTSTNNRPAVALWPNVFDIAVRETLLHANFVATLCCNAKHYAKPSRETSCVAAQHDPSIVTQGNSRDASITQRNVARPSG
jgi:hypothetical protein